MCGRWDWHRGGCRRRWYSQRGGSLNCPYKNGIGDYPLRLRKRSCPAPSHTPRPQKSHSPHQRLPYRTVGLWRHQRSSFFLYLWNGVRCLYLPEICGSRKTRTCHLCGECVERRTALSTWDLRSGRRDRHLQIQGFPDCLCQCLAIWQQCIYCSWGYDERRWTGCHHHGTVWCPRSPTDCCRLVYENIG